MTEPADSEALLDIKNLHVSFDTDVGTVQAVRGVDLKVPFGSIVGLVGESGSGKSVTAMTILGLHRQKKTLQSGSIVLDGQNILNLDERSLTQIRGKKASMIFQDPMTALNPVLSIGRQLTGVIRAHDPSIGREKATKRAVTLLKSVNLPDPENQMARYPHELSGGMRQRVMIAMATANEPQLIIADEPTTALDVTVQAQVLNILRDAKENTGAGVLLITHDLGVVAQMCDYVSVMYAGRIVESATVTDLFERPSHPYTKALLRSRPLMKEKKERLEAIPGMAASGASQISGCRFHPRCTLSSVTAGCDSINPALETQGGHSVACHRAEWDGTRWNLPIVIGEGA